MRHAVLLLAATFLVPAMTSSVHAAPARAIPLVSPAGASASRQHMELVKKKKSDSDSDSGERGWFDYLKAAATFSNDIDVTEDVSKNAIMEHLVGGLLASFGGHLWMPSVAYKESSSSTATTILAVISIVHAWMWLPLMVWWVIPYIGWFTGWFFLICWVVVNAFLQFWVIPRALQFAYSDNPPAEGGGSTKKKKKKADDDDE